MKALWADLKGSRTFWLCLAGALGCAQQGLAGEITWRQAVGGTFACVIGITLRHALEQAKPADPSPGPAPTTPPAEPQKEAPKP